MSEPALRLDGKLRQRLAQRYRVIDGFTARWLTEAGITWLQTNQEIVNNLNVFPVPDGDTGTNMMLTMQAAWQEVLELRESNSIGAVLQAIAHGALMGARGNSGVILSQIWRGFARTLDDRERMDAELFVRALHEARDTAYRGVVKPVEGTILTVAKDIAAAAEAALQSGRSSTLEILEVAVQAAETSVDETLELNPVLLEAGVVDAGGKGLFFLLEGMLRAVQGQSLDQPLISVKPLSSLGLDQAGEIIEPGQDWEVIVDFRPEGQMDVGTFYDRLGAMGTSIQVGEGDGLYRVHIHVPDRTEYEPIDYIRTLGVVTNVAIENLMIQMEQQVSSFAPKLAEVKQGQIAAIAVSPGPGISSVLGSLGVGAIVEGGQTMNPSTEHILAAVNDLPTDRMVVLPNNKNILLAAQQAAELSDRDVRVIPSASVPQGVCALLALDPEGEIDSVAQAMAAAMEEVRSGEITTATRSVVIDGVEVAEGQLIALLDGRLVVAADHLLEATLGLLKAADAAQSELVTLYYGSDLPGEEVEVIAAHVREAYPDLEIELLSGGQPHYLLIVSIE